LGCFWAVVARRSLANGLWCVVPGREKDVRLWFSRAAGRVFVVFVFLGSPAFAQRPTNFLPNPEPPEFIAYVQQDGRVTLARDQVIAILTTANSCSLWFHSLDPNPAATFASLRLSIDSTGPQYIIASPSNSGAMLFKHPYSARAFDKAGYGSVITLNAHGPFFVRVAPVLKRDIPGSALYHAGWRTLQVGSYLGDTPGAQITTLLHEFAHVVGRIPPDPNAFDGQSERNTAEVLRYCHAQVNAADRILRRIQPE
jgi:hypothetical protein